MRLTALAAALLLCACGPVDESTATAPSAGVASEAVTQAQTSGEILSAPTPPLNLSREHLNTLTDEQPEPGELLPVLPELFDDTPQRGVRLEPGLITNKEAKSLRDTVDGVELKLQIDRP